MLGMTKFGTISQGIMLPPLLVDYLVVAGGGGGSGCWGGHGGGGGQVLVGTKTDLLANTNYTVTIGGGGNGSKLVAGTGATGSVSVFSSLTALGGIGGTLEGNTGHGGASGNGHIGGTGYRTNYGEKGGGGGGDSANGSNYSGTVGGAGGAGGAGTSSSISGTSIGYGGGGGGGGARDTTVGAGADGGGNGGISGTVNRGGGGGGTHNNITVGNGGSGIVILRFPKAYTLTVSAGLTYTDTELDGDKIYTFTAGTGTVKFKAPFKGWLAGWLYGKSITIPSSSIDAELTNFPLTVYLNDTNFDFTKAEADGKDIRFTDGELNHLTFERKEHIAGTTKSAVYNVKIPTVSNTEDTEIYMWYGNSSATDTANTTGDVWDDNYVMVQHMGDSLVDATGNGNNATNVGSTVIDSELGKMRNFNGSSQYLTVADNPMLNMTTAFTISALVKYDSFPSFGGYDQSYILSRTTSDANDGQYGLSTDPNQYVTSFIKQSSYFAGTSASPVTTNTLYHLTARYGLSKQRIFTNGIASGDEVASLASITTTPTGNMQLGRMGASNYEYYVDGIIGEIRLSNIARSDAWIKAESLALKNELIKFSSIIESGVDGETVTPVDDYAIWLACGEIPNTFDSLANVIADTTARNVLTNDLNALRYMVRSSTIMTAVLADSGWVTALDNSSYSTHVPTMTGYSTPRGLVTGSGANYPTNPEWCIFDKDVSTFWDQVNSFPQHAQYAFTTPVNIYRCAIHVPNTGYGVTSFKVQTSYDNVTFSDVSSIITNAKGVMTSYLLPSGLPLANKYWRVVVLSNGGSNEMVLNEFDFFGLDLS